MKRQLLLLVSTLALLATSAFAQTKIPAYINYQGNVRSSTGVVIGAGTAVSRKVTFRFYKSSAGGAADRLWSESQSVVILDGNFSVLIGGGAVVPDEANSGLFAEVFGKSTSVYLGITVDDGTAAADPEISPRQQLVTTAYAFRATVAEKVDDAAINTGMIANNAITNTQILNGTIGVDDLATGAVTSDRIFDGTITSADIADKAIVNSELGDNAVTTDKIADGTITAADIAPSTIVKEDLIQAVQDALVPPGTVVAYGGTTAPTGWLMCDGTAYSQTNTEYKTLYDKIAYNFGGSAVTQTFNVPDFRGRFLRGVDSSTIPPARDPDRANRLAMNPGGQTGTNVGSIQDSAFQTHTHGYRQVTNEPVERYPAGSNSDAMRKAVNEGAASGSPTGNTSTETRPMNAYVNYIIKK